MKKNICFFLFLAFTVFLSCKNATENPKQKLLNAFKDQKIDSAWNFETAENDSMKTAAFRNKAIGERIEISSRDTSLVIGFFSRENKLTHSSMLFKSELFRHDSLLYVEITDPSGKQIDKILLPSAKKRVSITAPAQPSITTFGNFDACFYDFNCKQR